MSEELKAQLLRALADFDNFKKQSAREKDQFLQLANEALIVELLPILDGLNRATAAAESNQEILKGLALIKRQFEDVLAKFGVEEIKALGEKYDPHVHEAVLQKESDAEAGTIIEEMQKGYRLYNKVIRPAMVIVSKGGK